jgi:hypothetical protein
MDPEKIFADARLQIDPYGSRVSNNLSHRFFERKKQTTFAPTARCLS